ncbi:MAG: GIY-YIG nuclease family protein [Methanobacteriaceae archaeon]|nr:GIY-YIG nuclease family protein [Methanobacteriaceae archaeon]
MKGTYNLIICQKENINIKVGAIGNDIKFPKGYYVYTGSAMNSLTARIKRHLRKEKKLHWHIDYLLKNDNNYIKEVLFTISDKRVECELAQLISDKRETIDNFGSSDCKCNSHLTYFKDYDTAIENVENAYKTLNMKYHDLEYFKKLD